MQVLILNKFNKGPSQVVSYPDVKRVPSRMNFCNQVSVRDCHYHLFVALRPALLFICTAVGKYHYQGTTMLGSVACGCLLLKMLKQTGFPPLYFFIFLHLRRIIQLDSISVEMRIIERRSNCGGHQALTEKVTMLIAQEMLLFPKLNWKQVTAFIKNPPSQKNILNPYKIQRATIWI